MRNNNSRHRSSGWQGGVCVALLVWFLIAFSFEFLHRVNVVLEVKRENQVPLVLRYCDELLAIWISSLSFTCCHPLCSWLFIWEWHGSFCVPQGRQGNRGDLGQQGSQGPQVCSSCIWWIKLTCILGNAGMHVRGFCDQKACLTFGSMLAQCWGQVSKFVGTNLCRDGYRAFWN